MNPDELLLFALAELARLEREDVAANPT